MVSSSELMRVGAIRDHVDEEVMQVLPATAKKYGKDVEELARELKVFLDRKEQNILSLNDMGAFESFMVHKGKGNNENKHNVTPDGANKKKREGNFDTPLESKTMKVEENSDKKPAAAASSASTNSSATKKSNSASSVPYSQRKGKNEMTKQANEELGVRGEFEPSDQRPLGMRCKVTLKDEDFQNCKERYRFMHTPLGERAGRLDQHLMMMQAYMCEKAKIDPEEVSPVGVPSPDDVWVCGRVCCDSAVGTINKKSVLLEGSRRLSGGRRVSLDLEEIPALALFPGQIIMVHGVCASGRVMSAKKLLEGFPLDHPQTAPKQMLEYHHSTRYQNGKALSVMTAAGPYTEGNNLSYAPLEDLLSKVLTNKPDLLVLMGPFVDTSQEVLAAGDMVLAEEDNDGKVIGEHSASYEMVFVEKVIRDGVNAIFQAAADSGEDLPTNVVMIPSLLDGHHECVYPQPPFGDREPLDTPYFEEPLGVLNIKHSKQMDADKRVHLLPNPCMFRLNEILFGATSNDVLFNLSQDKVMEKTGGALERNAGHLLQQHSFSPQFPAPPKALAQMDLRHMPEWTMKQSPDVLLLPSKLGANGYISTVLDTLIVNPGTLVKGQSGGGTYAEMHIHPMKQEELLEAVKRAETEVKVEGSGSGSGLMKHGVAKRTHTKVIKI